MTPLKKKPRQSRDKVWRHELNSALYGLSQGFEGACLPKGDPEVARELYEMSLQKIEALFEEIIKAVPKSPDEKVEHP